MNQLEWMVAQAWWLWLLGLGPHPLAPGSSLIWGGLDAV